MKKAILVDRLKEFEGIVNKARALTNRVFEQESVEG